MEKSSPFSFGNLFDIINQSFKKEKSYTFRALLFKPSLINTSKIVLN